MSCIRTSVAMFLSVLSSPLLALLVSQPAGAESEPEAPAAAKAAAEPESTADLVQQLDADEFARREDASRKLTDRGAAAVPDLAKAAQGRSLEASARALAILKKFVTGEDNTLQGAAREALGQIAAQRQAAEKNKDDALASAAAKAAEILGQSQTPRYANAQPPIGIPQPAQPFRVRPRIILGGQQVVGNRISVKVVDGTREVDAEETLPDGQKRTVKIVSDPKSGIRMEVTAPKDGKPVTEKYAAKDVESLKKDHPEAAKIYEQYNGAGGAMKFGGGQIHIQGGRVEIGNGGFRVLPQQVPDIDLPVAPELEAEAEIQNQLRKILQAGPENGANVEAIEAMQRMLIQQQEQLIRQRQLRMEALRKRALQRAQPAPPAAPAPQPAPARSPQQVEDDLFGAPAPPPK